MPLNISVSDMSRVLPSGSFVSPQPTPCSSCALQSCDGKILSESAGDFCTVISCLCLSNLMFSLLSSKMCHPLQEAQQLLEQRNELPMAAVNDFYLFRGFEMNLLANSGSGCCS